MPNILLSSGFSNWEEFREQLRANLVDVVGVNLDGPEGPELDIVRRMARIAPSCGIIGISKNVDSASIITAMRAGCSQFVCRPIETRDLCDAVEQIRVLRQSVAYESRRVCVIGSSGGAGATTVACNLAMELAHLAHRRSVLVDLNLEFGDVACTFDCSPRFSVADVCQEAVEADRAMLGQAVHELPCNVSILGRPEKLEDCRQITPEGVKNVMRLLSEIFPFVVVDLPRYSNPIGTAAVYKADHILIVTQLGVPDIRNATRLYERLRDEGTPEEQIEIVLNRYKSLYERITPADVEAHFGKPLFGLIPNDYHRVQSSLDLGHPIVADSPNSPSRLAIANIAKKIAGDSGLEGESQRGAVGRLFNRLWSGSPDHEAKAVSV